MIWRSHRVQDAAFGAAIAALMILELCLTSERSGPLALNLLILPWAGLSLALRRTRPLVPAVTLLVVFSIGTAADLTAAQDIASALLPLLTASYAAGRYLPDPRQAVPIGIALIVVINVGASRNTADDWVFPVLMMGGAGLTGRALRTRALVAAELAEQTERLALEHDLRAAEAAIEERRRIARELHDVVAHTLSVMVVQAGAARRTLDRDAGLALDALTTVEATGRSALGELRRLLGFVGDPAAPHAPLEPAPTLADLPALARRAEAAGLPTTFNQDGAPLAAGTLPAGAEVAVFRIAQEALTNAIKHAGPGATAAMTLHRADGALTLEVHNAAPARATADIPLPSGGHGLVGMRERVALYGGELTAGPVTGGGFRVVARLPLHGAAVPA